MFCSKGVGIPNMRTQVGIIGAGPAGLFLSHLLHRAGIESVIVEAQSRSYVEGRVRAGVLEPGTVETLEMLGLDTRMRREGMVDEGLDIRFRGKNIHLDLPALTGKRVMIYGQQEVVKDLIVARLKASQALLWEAKVSRLSDLDGSRPKIHFSHDGRDQILECDYIAGCDGFHGVSRSAAPSGQIVGYERVYDFAWLGVLSRSKPISDMTYTNSDRGFALCSRRSNAVSRLYLQIDADDDHKSWSDDRFWDELHARMFDEGRTEIAEGEIFQRDIARLRSFVASPMQYGRLLLAGDAVHITPPAGAKGLNLAVADVRVMAAALIEFYRNGNSDGLNGYSEKCLDRVWKTVRFSTMLTGLLHKFPKHSAFERNLQLTELEYILGSRAAQTTIAEQYVGTPLESI
jgi:p-hydroxybenzoate 3-monooxygenase